MPFLHTELLVFQPIRDVVFGMPIFVGDDRNVLCELLRQYRAPGDDRSVWCAALAGAPPRWQLRVAFTRGAGSTLARILTQAAGSTWRLEPGVPGSDPEAPDRKRDGAVLELPHVWWARGMRAAHTILASDAALTRLQAGFWIPCNGAVALDLSGLPPGRDLASYATVISELALLEPTLLDSSASASVERLIDQHGVMAALRGRAECCFLFHVESQESAAAGGPDPVTRRGRLFEGTLHMAMPRHEFDDMVP